MQGRRVQPRGPPAPGRQGGAPGAAPARRVHHDLYVKIVVAPDRDTKSPGYTLEVLRYIHSNLAKLAAMGISVRVNKITSTQLLNERLRAVMKQRGLLRLPALRSPHDIYLGFQEIRNLYETNFAEYEAIQRQSARPVTGEAPDDEFAEFYRDEMTFERAYEDESETGIGEGGDMMDSYRRMMERREASEKNRKPRTRAGARPAAAPEPAADGPREPRGAPRGAPRPSGSSRPDNVARIPTRTPVDEDDAEIQSTIDRLARDIDDNLREAAFSSTGGDSLDDDGGADPQDDLMEQAYWARAAETGY